MFGIVNTLVSNAVYAVLVIAGIAPQLALAISYPVAIVWAYFTSARFVFGQRGFRKLPAYFLCYVAVYGVNAGGLHIVMGVGVSPLLAQAVLLPFVVVFSYTLTSYVLTGSVVAYRKQNTPS